MPKKKKTINKELEAKFFSDDVLVSKEKAKQILEVIYDMGLDARDMGHVVWRIRDYIVNEMLADIVEDMDIEKIKELVQQISVELLNPECAPGYECDKQRYTNADIAWFFASFAEAKTYEPGDMVEVQIMRVGKRNHPSYGEIEVTADTIAEVKTNFDENKRGIELAVDENHEDNHKALGWFKELYIDGDGLYAKIELTKAGADLLTQGAYKYFSPEIIMKKVDEESGEVITNLLVGGAFTNRPFFKMMDPIMANESSGVSNQQQNKDDEANKSYIYLYNANEHMNKFMQLAKQFSAKESLSKDELNQLQTAFNELSGEDQKNLKTKNVYETLCEKYSEETPEQPADAPADPEAPADETPKGDENDGEQPADAPADPEAPADKAIEATEKKTVTIQASEYQKFKELQAQNAKLLHEAKVKKTADDLNKYAFSESNNKGLILPKDKQAVVDFAAGLSDKDQTKFFEILDNITKVKFNVVETKELGSTGGEAGNKEDQVDALTKKYTDGGMKKKDAFRKAFAEVYKSLDDEDTDEIK